MEKTAPCYDCKTEATLQSIKRPTEMFSVALCAACIAKQGKTKGGT